MVEEASQLDAAGVLKDAGELADRARLPIKDTQATRHPKTVSVHVSHILDKLGVRSRVKRLRSPESADSSDFLVDRFREIGISSDVPGVGTAHRRFIDDTRSRR